MDSLGFWIPLFLLFFSALVGALIKRRTCDPCLKKFHGDKVLFPIAEDKWICGELKVFAQGIEVSKLAENKISCGIVHSRIFPAAELINLSYFIRQAPDPDTRAGVKWKKEREKLLHPPLWNRVKRFSLNSYNMLRDSFGQALKAIIGSVSKQTRFGQTKDADHRLYELQSNMTGLVPNSWEPILEKYRGKLVAVERMAESGEIFESGILEDYSDKYLLMRDVVLVDSSIKNKISLLKESQNPAYDVLYSRTHALLRFSLQAQP